MSTDREEREAHLDGGESNDALTQSVERQGDVWVGTCDHGDVVWYIERGTEHNAWRSLRAHARWEHADLRPDTRVIPPGGSDV